MFIAKRSAQPSLRSLGNACSASPRATAAWPWLRPFPLCPVLLAFACLIPEQLSAQTGVLTTRTGGSLAGKVVQPKDGSKALYRVETASGTTWELKSSLVTATKAESARQAAYRERAFRTRNTPAEQFALASWCEAEGFKKEAELHLRHVLELDPQHAEARKELKYELVNGEWLTKEEQMARQGYFFYKGKYRTQQEIDRLKEKAQATQESSQWLKQVKIACRWLKVPDKFDRGARELSNIEDPAAVKALSQALQEIAASADVAGETSREERLLVLTHCLGHINSDEARDTLADQTLFAEFEEVRLTALDYLKDQPKNQGLADHFIDALKHEDVEIVRRAAHALGKVGSQRGVEPLIDVLMFERTRTVAANSPEYNLSFNPQGGIGGFSTGKAPPIKVRETYRLDEALHALEALTQQKFGYNQDAWRSWFKTDLAPKIGDLRRDPG